MRSYEEVSVRSQVAAVMESVLLVPVPLTGLSRLDEPQWDSLRHIELALFLEESFDVRFSAEEISSMTSSGVIVELIEAKRS